jgi:hypothetical protein
VTVQASGACPSAAAVERELHRILPTLEVSHDVARARTIAIREEATRVSVELDDAERVFVDEGGGCDERASQVAVWLALMLDPLRSPPAPVAPKKDSGPSPPLVATPQAPFALEIGPNFAVALGSGSSPTPLAGGGGVRFAWGRSLALSGGFAVMSSTTLHYARADAAEQWFPFDLGARLVLLRASWDAALEASAVVAPAYLEGRALDVTKGGFRVELGARGALLARWWLGERVGLVFTEAATWWPNPVSLRVGGAGEVGDTPPLWLATQLALALKIN